MKLCIIPLALIALLSLGLGSIASAQGPGGGRMGGPGGMRMKPGERDKQMIATLGVNATQTKKIDKVIDEMVAKMTAMRPPKGSKPSPEMFKKFMAVRQDYDAKIGKILTPAQKKKWDAMRAAMMARFRSMGGGGMGRGPGGPPGAPGH